MSEEKGELLPPRIPLGCFGTIAGFVLLAAIVTLWCVKGWA